MLQDKALCGAAVSPDQHARAVAAACDVELNKSDDCGDGDQSLLRHHGPQDATAQALKNVWGAGGDFLVALAQDRLSVCMKAAALGDTKTVEEQIAKANAEGAEAISQLLERRETLPRFTPLDGAIMGAIQWAHGLKVGWLHSEVCTKHGGQHAQVAQLLLAAKARPNAKDVCGFTPLARCVTTAANSVTLEIGMLGGRKRGQPLRRCAASRRRQRQSSGLRHAPVRGRGRSDDCRPFYSLPESV